MNKRRLTSQAARLWYMWSPFSGAYQNLYYMCPERNWVLDREISELKAITDAFGIVSKLSNLSEVGDVLRQSIFFSDKYFLRKPVKFIKNRNRIAFPYFHGYPTSGDETAVRCYENLKRIHSKISRVQVSHSRMRDLVLETGIASEKVFLIPIGINLDLFQPQTKASRKTFRNKYGIPQNAVVVGSFQKDGDGWQEGMTPKLIKGPDLFLETVRILKDTISDLFVLLSGPARGYVKSGLERKQIPYTHIYLEDYAQIGELFHCLDIYLVSSREEGGPKAVLESMASGIPLVTTRVGQAMDLVRSGENGYLCDVGDAEAIAEAARILLEDSCRRHQCMSGGFETARENSYTAQRILWKQFFSDFVHFNTVSTDEEIRLN